MDADAPSTRRPDRGGRGGPPGDRRGSGAAGGAGRGPEKSNRDLEQFAYVASHDLQEPLRKVASFCQMLQRQLRRASWTRGPTSTSTYARRRRASGCRQLINDVAGRSPGSAGPRSRETVVDLRSAWSSRCRTSRVSQRESGAEITWDPLPSVRGEPALLTQLLQNLLANAIKFRSEAAPRAHIGVRRERDHWQFSCEDSGIGIESRYAERVFLIFQQLHTRRDVQRYRDRSGPVPQNRGVSRGMIWVEQRPRPRYHDPLDAPGGARRPGRRRRRQRGAAAVPGRVARGATRRRRLRTGGCDRGERTR